MIRMHMPPSLNSMYRARTMGKGPRAVTVIYKSKEAKQYDHDLRSLYAHFRAQVISKPLDIAVTIGMWMPRRGTDLDDRLKCLLDAISATKTEPGIVCEDDCQIAHLNVFRVGYDTKNPRIEMTWRVVEQDDVAALYASALAFNQMFGAGGAAL